MNQIILIGNVGSDPTTSSNGQDIANFPLAVTKKFKDRAGNKQETTDWFRVVGWGFTAKFMQQHVRKGCKIMVMGELRNRKWTNREGQEITSTEIHADKVEMLTWPKEQESRGRQVSESDDNY